MISMALTMSLDVLGTSETQPTSCFSEVQASSSQTGYVHPETIMCFPRLLDAPLSTWLKLGSGGGGTHRSPTCQRCLR